MARPSAADRLLRLLALPAWVAARPGVTVREAAEHFEVSEETIIRDVEALWVSGPRDAMPDELVDFDALELEEGRLRLTTSLGLDTPLRLTSQEALALQLSLRVLADLLQGTRRRPARWSGPSRRWPVCWGTAGWSRPAGRRRRRRRWPWCAGPWRCAAA